jgi:hypothetical protein
MRFTLTFKDPDGPSECLREAVTESIPFTITDPEEIDQLIDSRLEDLREFIEPWVQWGEYVSIEFDTETKTAKVVRR